MYSVLANSIVFYNSAPSGSNYFYLTDSFTALNYCDTTPLPTYGVGNIDAEPLFVDTNGWRNLRLQPDSPCINAGNNAYVFTATDLDGNPRILGGTVDMGAYECSSPTSLIERMMSLVSQSGLHHSQPLLATLGSALDSLNRGNSIAASNQLQAFQKKVLAQVAPLDAALAGTLIQNAQQLIDELKGH
jgi:hypothetical protein